MKTCPNCGELVGDSVELCFKCKYNFEFGCITATEEEKNQMQQKKRTQLQHNPFFEYQVVIVNNLETGEINQVKIQDELDLWSSKGWKLHSIFNNELGKTSSTISIGFLGANVNATIDQTVIIFERCIKA